MKVEKGIFTLIWSLKTRLVDMEGEEVKTKSIENEKKNKDQDLGLSGRQIQQSVNHSVLSSPLHPNAQNPTKIGIKVGEGSPALHSPRIPPLSSERSFLLTLGSVRYEFHRWEPVHGRVISRPFALDAETTLIDENRRDVIPNLVLGMAFDGQQGFFILAEDMAAFLAAHPSNPLIFHNAAFDLAVLQKQLGPDRDIYARVDAGKVADTMVLARLLSLGSLGHSARKQCSLDYCTGHYLNLQLPKDLQGPDGETVRLSFGRYLGRPLEVFPEVYLQYAAADSVATWLLFQQLKSRLPDIKSNASQAYGYAGERWLEKQWKKHGPGTHDIQLKASIALDRISRPGVLIDQARKDEKVAALEKIVTETRCKLALAGLPIEGAGKTSALQKRIKRLANEHRRAKDFLHLNYTETGQIATDEEQLKELAAIDPVLDDLLKHRQATKLLSTYTEKMVPGKRIHGKFKYLMNTGRTSCGGGFNLQNLPKERDAASKNENTIRGCFVPPPGNVFVVVDYAQIELVVLGWAWKHQLRFGSNLHEIVSEGGDMHRLIASKVLGKGAADVTKDERNAAKPVSLGRPGGLGCHTIQKQAKTDYGVELTEEQVRERMAAYETLCPELTKHLKSRVNAGLEIALALGLTPAAYNAAIGKPRLYPTPEDEQPAGWLGGMLLKVLESPVPMTGGNPDNGNQPRPYTPVELEFYWHAAARLPTDELDQKLRDAIRERKPSKRLRDAVRALYSRESVITATGRLRANASYSACRNGIMQGLAADGAIYALWSLMRAGYTIVNFIHDEVIIEVLEDENLPAVIADIEQLMITGMQTVVPGANVRVETEVRRSFSKADLKPDPRLGESRKSGRINESLPSADNKRKSVW